MLIETKYKPINVKTLSAKSKHVLNKCSEKNKKNISLTIRKLLLSATKSARKYFLKKLTTKFKSDENIFSKKC